MTLVLCVFFVDEGYALEGFILCIPFQDRVPANGIILTEEPDPEVDDGGGVTP